MKLLMVGDIVGSPGRTAFARIAGLMKREGRVDFVIANAENAAAGRGATPGLAEELFAAGADVITMGDHMWDQKELAAHLAREPRILRPANFPPGCPGRGWITVPTPLGPVTVISLIGRVFMPPNDCPFRAADAILQKAGELGKMIVVEIHAEATSEKIALGRYLDGRVSVVAGSHTHVQTADDKILPKGTGFLTDLGMTGPHDSIIGRDVKSVLNKFLTGMPTKFDVAEDAVRFEGVIVQMDPSTGRTIRLKRVQEAVDPLEKPA